MSRSKWAWTEGCVPVGAAGAALASGLGSRIKHASVEGPCSGAVSSTKRLVKLMAASMFVHGARAGLSAGGVRERLARQVPDPQQAKSAHVDRAGAVVLALGSGYSSRAGAARVRVLQRSWRGRVSRPARSMVAMARSPSGGQSLPGRPWFAG